MRTVKLAVGFSAAFVTFVLVAAPVNVTAVQKSHGPKVTSTTTAKGSVKSGATSAKSTAPKGQSAKAGGSTTKTTSGSTKTTGKGKAPVTTTATSSSAKKTAAAGGATTATSSTTNSSTGTSTTGTSTTGTSTTWTPTNPVAQKLSTKSNLVQKANRVLPANTDLNLATAGFKNFGQFVAAVNVSQNLKIPFADLKLAMTGIPLSGTSTTGTGGSTTPATTLSLGQAIQKLKPEVNATVEAEHAQTQAAIETGETSKVTTTATTTKNGKSK